MSRDGKARSSCEKMRVTKILWGAMCCPKQTESPKKNILVCGLLIARHQVGEAGGAVVKLPLPEFQGKEAPDIASEFRFLADFGNDLVVVHKIAGAGLLG